MKFYFVIIYFFLLSACSLSNNSDYWHKEKNDINNKKINKTESVIKNSNNKEASKFNKNISFEQFKEFLKKYAETNPYPNIDE